MIDVLIADDEAPALDELDYLLRRDPRVNAIHRAMSGPEALQCLTTVAVDGAFLDIHMPGLSGLDLARAVERFESRPAVVFVTADEERALEAFTLAATDYLLKPLREPRLHQSVTRIAATRSRGGVPLDGSVATPPDETIMVAVGALIRRVRRSDVRYAQAQGDYARLHTDTASHLVRIPLSDLEQQWSGAGFLRIHRSFLVGMNSVTSVRLGAHPTLTVAGVNLPISRRLLPSVRAAFVASHGWRPER